MNNWIQIGIWAAAIAIVFGILWWQGQIKRLSGYCQETWVELQKCTWPTWDELKGSTALIIIMIGMLGGFIVLLDLLFEFIFFHKS